MYTTDELLNLLSNGKSSDELAADFTKSLNSAIQMKKEKDSETDKLEWLADIVSQTDEWLAEYYPSLASTKDPLESAKTIAATIETLSKLGDSLSSDSLGNGLNSLLSILKF